MIYADLTVPYQEATAIAIVAAVAALGFIAGLMGIRYAKAPWIATGLILLGYGVLVAVSIGWYESCRNCESAFSYDSTRGLEVLLALVWGFFVAAPIIAIIWLGALLSRVFVHLRRGAM
jgi:hypothetical protein